MVLHPGVIRPEDWLRFVHLTPFTRKWSKLGLDDDDLRALEVVIMAKPTLGPVIRGTGGLRKIRFTGEDSKRGKRGAFRVCYVFFDDDSIVLLVTVFGKAEQDDLTEAGKKAIAAVIAEVKESLDKGIFDAEN